MGVFGSKGASQENVNGIKTHLVGVNQTLSSLRKNVNGHRNFITKVTKIQQETRRAENAKERERARQGEPRLLMHGSVQPSVPHLRGSSTYQDPGAGAAGLAPGAPVPASGAVPAPASGAAPAPAPGAPAPAPAPGAPAPGAQGGSKNRKRRSHTRSRRNRKSRKNRK